MHMYKTLTKYTKLKYTKLKYTKLKYTKTYKKIKNIQK